MKDTHFADNDRKKALTIIVTALLTLVSIVVCTAIGTVKFSFFQTIRAIFVNDDSTARLLIWNLRLPRVLTGALVGICLSLSGCILQGLMHNSLASPSTIGVTSGASLLGYITLVAFPSLGRLLPIGSILGALGTTLLIYGLAYRKGASNIRIILSGLAVSALFGAFSDMIRSAFPDRVSNATGFLVGSLNGTTWSSLLSILPYAGLGIAICIFLPIRMNVLQLGEESARALGLDTERFRLVLILSSSLLSGSAISVAGIVGFAGLIVPHMARLLVGSDHRYLFAQSSLMGAVLVIVCDTIGRVVMAPGEIPVSVILAFIGTPFFLYLLRKKEAL